MIRPMDRRVTRDARPGKDADARVRTGPNDRGVVNRAWMARRDMAALTGNGRLGDEHALVRRAVRVVTGHAAVTAGRVLPEERAALIGVARGAGLANGVALAQQPHVGRAVHVVARGALEFALAHRHVARSIQLGELVAMTRGADRGLRFFLQLFGLRLVVVHAVARRTRQLPRIVLAAIPECVLAAIVTCRARGAHVVR